ncbi:hypothetical protein GCM10012286_31670 [Streptomyces lasiicapitis]|uniref:Uncharacterized protein n=1 Tax=Streptomyces lasiicapitis TaxID=1923961 RepID=A0ABQ2LYT1_9ACTN|nr:hypothetical protein GCM10012286_31670 [Streptomyces lasiicapitis]
MTRNLQEQDSDVVYVSTIDARSGAPEPASPAGRGRRGNFRSVCCVLRDRWSYVGGGAAGRRQGEDPRGGRGGDGDGSGHG